jgi:hypothetical protein
VRPVGELRVDLPTDRPLRVDDGKLADGCRFVAWRAGCRDVADE